MLKLKSNQEIKYKKKIIKKKKKPKQKKIVGGIELYGHTYMLIVGQQVKVKVCSIAFHSHVYEDSDRKLGR